MSGAVDEQKQPSHQEEEVIASAGIEDFVESSERVGETACQSSQPNDWTTAALAHASVVLTLLFAFAGGVGALVGLAIPLVVYLSYRGRSRFIAFHALQSLVYQGAGMLVYIALLVASAAAVAAAWAISGVLSTVVIGFLLMPLALVITIVAAVALLGAPLLLAGYGLYAAYRVYQGEDFRYTLLGEWLEREVEL